MANTAVLSAPLRLPTVLSLNEAWRGLGVTCQLNTALLCCHSEDLASALCESHGSTLVNTGSRVASCSLELYIFHLPPSP
ncbi:mCG148140 [Mus musculus]|nr:mCG148140 [Mus musculus]